MTCYIVCYEMSVGHLHTVVLIFLFRCLTKLFKFSHVIPLIMKLPVVKYSPVGAVLDT